MARIKGGLNAKKKHNRVLKLAKGYRGARSKQYRVAKQSVMRALTSSYAGRKERKDWIGTPTSYSPVLPPKPPGLAASVQLNPSGE